uniref:Uncharacterized protein n=1 Tax=Globodera rostochiensis TaxID=31243 RepID=A0A914HSA6_GLORO
MIKVYSLAFCVVLLIGTVFADFKKCSDALAFDGPGNNVLLKLFKESQLEDEELKQFVCDLGEHEIVIGAAFDDQAQGLPPTISPSLKEEFEFLKKSELVDKPAAELLHKLHKSISALKHSINEGITVKNSVLKAIKSELVQTLRLLADRWQIPADEIVPMEKKMGQESLLRELAKLWNEYKRQNWKNDQNSNESNYGKGQHEKRMLQLMMDLSSDGSGGLPDLKSAKKRQQRRRRKKRGNTQSYIAIAAVVVVAVILTLGLCACLQRCQYSDGHGNALESGRPRGQRSGTMPYRGHQSMDNYGGHRSSTYGHGGNRNTRRSNHRENRPSNYPNNQHLGQPPSPGRFVPLPPGYEEEDEHGCTIV